MEEVTPFKRTEILEWTVEEFKHNLRYVAWKGWTVEKYEKIMRDKKK